MKFSVEKKKVQLHNKQKLWIGFYFALREGISVDYQTVNDAVEYMYELII